MPKPPALLSSLKMLDDSTAELQIMDEIVRDSGWLGGVSDRDVRGWLAEAGGRDLTVRINSPGGDAFGGVSIHNALRDHSGAVSVVVSGVAASAASVIAMAGDSVTMQPGSMMMIHRAQAIAFGTADEVDSAAQLLRKMDASMSSIYAGRALADEQEIGELMAATHWMTAAEAVAQGFADSVEGEDLAAPVAVHPSTYSQWGAVPSVAASLFAVSATGPDPKVLASRKDFAGSLSPAGDTRQENDPMSLIELSALLACDPEEVEAKIGAVLATSDARAQTIEEQGTRLAAYEADEATRATADFSAMLDAGQDGGRWTLAERDGVEATLRAVGCLRAADLADLPAGVYPEGRHKIAATDSPKESIDLDPAPRSEQVRSLALTFAEARGAVAYNPEELRRARRSIYGD